MSRVVFVRHAQPAVEPHVDARQWRLRPEGRDAASRLGTSLVGRISPSIIASAEPKAIETAELLAASVGASTGIAVDHRFGEVDRPWIDGDLSVHIRRYLAGEDLPGWESQEVAVTRFDQAVKALQRPTTVVTHGTVLALWLARLVEVVDAFDLWTSLRMPDAFEVDPASRSFARIE